MEKQQTLSGEKIKTHNKQVDGVRMRITIKGFLVSTSLAMFPDSVVGACNKHINKPQTIW